MTDPELSYIDPAGVVTELRRLPGTSGRFMPPIVMIDEAVVGQDGGRLRDVRFGPKQVVVPITLAAADATSYRQLLREIVKKLNPKRGEGILRSTVDGQTRDLRCRYLDGMGFTEDWPLFGKPSLLFRAHDPFWYDAAPMTSTFTTGAQPGFLGNPFLPIKLASDTVLGEQTVANDGDVETWPVWTIKGPATSITLSNVTTGEELVLPITLTSSQSVIIDTRPFVKTVRRDDGTNLFGSVTGSLWALGEGDTIINAQVTGSTVDTFVTLVFYRRYLSP